LPSHVKYWSGIEALVKEAIAPATVAKQYPARKKTANRGLGMGPVEDFAENEGQ